MRFSVISSLFALAATGSAAVVGKGKGKAGGVGPAAVKPDILLVPGAWHTPAAFDLVRDQLTRRGFQSTAVPLLTVGPTDPLNQGVPEDAAAIRAELEKLVDAGKEVMVISHSYGGVPAAAAVEGLNLKDRAAQGQKGGVLMVVHMTSFAAKVGTSLMDSLGGNPLPWFNITGDILTPINPVKVFYADVEPKLAEKSAEAILPSSLRAMTDKGTFAPWDAGFQMGFIHTEDDQAIPIAIQKQMAAQFPRRLFLCHPQVQPLAFPQHAGAAQRGYRAGFRVCQEAVKGF
ncbi:Alpha/beta hydrolase fold-1 [Apiospora kogelbergensis]|uniref:Alpha/beta hydrolase fold-1 n=1 Tax=Apiospora kogelbergensis TaxID=1337665 RepID=UPI00313061AD